MAARHARSNDKSGAINEGNREEGARRRSGRTQASAPRQKRAEGDQANHAAGDCPPGLIRRRTFSHRADQLLQLIERRPLLARRCWLTVVKKVQGAPGLGLLRLVSEVAENHAQQRRQGHQQCDPCTTHRARQAKRPAPGAICAHGEGYSNPATLMGGCSGLSDQ